MLVQHGKLHICLQREAPSTGVLVHQTLKRGECSAVSVGLPARSQSGQRQTLEQLQYSLGTAVTEAYIKSQGAFVQAFNHVP